MKVTILRDDSVALGNPFEVELNNYMGFPHHLERDAKEYCDIEDWTDEEVKVIVDVEDYDKELTINLEGLKDHLLTNKKVEVFYKDQIELHQRFVDGETEVDARNYFVYYIEDLNGTAWFYADDMENKELFIYKCEKTLAELTEDEKERMIEYSCGIGSGETFHLSDWFMCGMLMECNETIVNHK